ncbi:HPr kinase/phosphatase C-terminal domain-containing protein [Methylobacterium organophilum]|uniref:HPr kinase/phosphorylase n=1 Tax=Methylobacterium organophilum TaxID=410 RepID=UPI001F13E95F|nr:HPr kinase/phosphatase C-terminal domain-containing protein [Methylobacterium organophilum]UMY18232.1 HPr kinase/phosphatase C-terminal domain-containing protein [Methylobacterium organophilum]
MLREPDADATTIHGNCVLLGEAGILIRGESGAGKSALCLALIDEAERDRLHARLVADDRVRLTRRHGRLIARPHPTLAGRIELRGLGIRTLPTHAEAAVLRLVVDLVPHRPRMPETAEEKTEILGLRLPVLTLEPRQPGPYLIREVLRSMSVARQSHPGSVLARNAADP